MILSTFELSAYVDICSVSLERYIKREWCG